MKQADLNLLERQVGAGPTSYQTQRQAPAAAPLSRSVVGVFCNRLKRAMAAHDPVATGQARGMLNRLALQNHHRLAKAKRASHQMITLRVDA